MAHNIDETTGKPAMFFVGSEPWHGLGTKLDKEATSEEALKAAGMDWKVAKEPVSFKLGDTWKPVPDAFATVRQDTNAPLGMVGKRYTVLQNREAFSFGDAMVGIKGAIYHTAGALDEGRKVWLLAKLKGVVRVIGDDVAEKFLLLVNTHDGSGSVKVMLTPIRVVCQNALNQAIGSSDNTFRMRHTPGMGLKVEEAQKALGIVSAKFDIFEEAARKLATTSLTVEASKAFFVKAANRYGVAPENVEELPAKTKTIIEEMSRLFEEGRGADLPGARGTLWGAYNAVVEYADFYRATKGGNALAIRQGRADSALFGTGAAMKDRAWKDALDLAGAVKSSVWP